MTVRIYITVGKHPWHAWWYAKYEINDSSLYGSEGELAGSFPTSSRAIESAKEHALSTVNIHGLGDVTQIDFEVNKL